MTDKVYNRLWFPISEMWKMLKNMWSKTAENKASCLCNISRVRLYILKSIKEVKIEGKKGKNLEEFI